MYLLYLVEVIFEIECIEEFRGVGVLGLQRADVFVPRLQFSPFAHMDVTLTHLTWKDYVTLLTFDLCMDFELYIDLDLYLDSQYKSNTLRFHS